MIQSYFSFLVWSSSLLGNQLSWHWNQFRFWFRVHLLDCCRPHKALLTRICNPESKQDSHEYLDKGECLSIPWWRVHEVPRRKLEDFLLLHVARCIFLRCDLDRQHKISCDQNRRDILPNSCPVVLWIFLEIAVFPERISTRPNHFLCFWWCFLLLGWAFF